MENQENVNLKFELSLPMDQAEKMRNAMITYAAEHEFPLHCDPIEEPYIPYPGEESRTPEQWQLVLAEMAEDLEQSWRRGVNVRISGYLMCLPTPELRVQFRRMVTVGQSERVVQVTRALVDDISRQIEEANWRRSPLANTFSNSIDCVSQEVKDILEQIDVEVKQRAQRLSEKEVTENFLAKQNEKADAELAVSQAAYWEAFRNRPLPVSPLPPEANAGIDLAKKRAAEHGFDVSHTA